MMTSIRAHFDGNVLIPDEPIELPIGCPLEVRITPLNPPASPKNPLGKLAELMGKFPVSPDLPADAAAQHDHYLYGVPKRP